MNGILALFGLLSIPLMLLNMLGGIVSAIWLAFVGDWRSIGYGIFAMMISGILIPIALMPALLLAGPATYFAEKQISFLFYFFAFLSSLYIMVLMTFWCGGVLWFFALRATASSIIPILIWSYGVALAPWQWLAKGAAQGGHGDASATTTFFAQVGYVVMVIVALVERVFFYEALRFFVIIMLVGVIFQFISTIQTMRVSKLETHGFVQSDGDT